MRSVIFIKFLQARGAQCRQVVLEKIFFPCNGSTPLGPHTGPGNDPPRAQQPQRPRPAPIRRPETPAPETLLVTDDLRRWAADTVPGLPLEHERDKFLCYARAHGLTNVDWAEALKWWWLDAHARAVRRGELQLPAAPRPTLGPEPPPLYNVELHRQMQADIVRLCGPAGPSVLGMNDGQKAYRRRTSSTLATEDAALEHGPAYLAQMRARKATLQAQAALLQARGLCLEAVGVGG
jgi:hypothetical protein